MTRRSISLLIIAAVALSVLTALPSSAQGRSSLSASRPHWTELEPPASPPGTVWAAAAYDPKNDQVVMSGGNSGGGGSTATWVFDGDTWTRLELAAYPDFRLNAAMAYDPSRQEIVLFGGSCDCPARRYDDTWVFDGSTWSERTPETSPPALFGARMAYDPQRREVVMFGGWGVNRVTNQTWVWDGDTWTRRHPDVSPPDRYAAGMAYSKRLGAIVLFGGQGRDGSGFADTWLWDDGAWTKLPDASGGPPRSGVVMASMGRGVMMFGGRVKVHQSGLNDTTWILGGGGQWHRRAPDVGPSARFGAAMVYDTTRRRVVLFGGGSRGGGSPPDTWVFHR